MLMSETVFLTGLKVSMHAFILFYFICCYVLNNIEFDFRTENPADVQYLNCLVSSMNNCSALESIP